ncbi:MAG: SIMPL domain-containing protein [Thiomonas sp.]
MPPFPALCPALRAAGVLFAVCLATAPALAQTAAAEPSGVVELQATAQTEVSPDLAVMTLAVERSGTDAAALTAQVSQALQAALQRARAVSGVQAGSGGFSTQPQWKTVDGKPQRDGWTVRAALLLKSRDVDALGRLAGQLAQHGLLVESSAFEVSSALREREETALIQAAIARFQSKATTAARALGYAHDTLRTLQIGAVQEQTPSPRPLMLRAAGALQAETATAVPLASAPVTLQLTVQGSVQLGH